MPATFVQSFFILVYLAILGLFVPHYSIPTCAIVYKDVNYLLDSEYIKEMWFKIKNFKQPSNILDQLVFAET